MTAPVTPSQAVLNAASAARSITSPVVVKLGGSAMEEPTATRGTLECVAALHTLGLKLVLVHGGGKPIDRAMAAAGIEPRKVQGRRYTDDATLEIVVRVLCEINAGLVQRLGELGVPAQGFQALNSFPLRGELLTLDGVDLGFVGRPTAVESPALAGQALPVVPSLCRAGGGGWLNVNADTAAAAIAGAFPSEQCLFLTDTAGVLRDYRDTSTLFPRLTVKECRELIAAGVIAGGMIPKVEACFDALRAGAKRAVILDGRRPHALSDWLLGEPAGTTIVPG